MKVFKFGGASLQKSWGVKNASNIIIQNIDSPLLVVVSAMGKTTALLEKIAYQVFENKDYQHFLDEFYFYHNNIVKELLLEEKINKDIEYWYKSILIDIQNCHEFSKFSEFYDKIVAYGELISSVILYNYLVQNYFNYKIKWIDARELIKTDDFFRSANIDINLTNKNVKEFFSPYLNEDNICIIQGFIASSKEGKTTTLGKEGSDFSAAILASILNANSLTVWKDVEGIMNADPKIYENPELFEFISYNDIFELSKNGAKIIHPKTIKPLADNNIPLFIKSFLDPKALGTKVGHLLKDSNSIDKERLVLDTILPVFILRENQTMLKLKLNTDNNLLDFLSDNIYLDRFYSCFSENTKYLDHINFIYFDKTNIILALSSDYDILNAFFNILNPYFKIHYENYIELITIKNYNPSLDLPYYVKKKNIILEVKTQSNYQAIIK